MSDNRGEKFLIDAMLGNVVSWLRILGYDSEYWEGDDNGLIEKARMEDRIILTKDRELYLYAKRCNVETILIDENETERVLGTLNRLRKICLEFDPEQTRCPMCNHLLKRDNNIREEWVCDNCGKRYWMGRHWKNISRLLHEAKNIGGRS